MDILNELEGLSGFGDDVGNCTPTGDGWNCEKYAVSGKSYQKDRGYYEVWYIRPDNLEFASEAALQDWLYKNYGANASISQIELGSGRRIKEIYAKEKSAATSQAIVETARPPPCEGAGDLDGDGMITKKDLTRATLIYFGETPTDDELYYGDVDGDGEIGKNDVELIQQYLEGKINTFPVCEGLEGLDILGELEGMI